MSDTVVTAPDAKFSLDDLLTRVEAGEEIVITRDGRPVARLVPAPLRPAVPQPDVAVSTEVFAHPTPRKRRQFGLYAGLASIGPEFFEPLPEDELRLWEGGDD